MRFVSLLAALLLVGCSGKLAQEQQADATAGQEASTSASDARLDRGADTSLLADNGSGSSGGRIQLTIDHTKVASSLTDFPLLVHLSSSSGINQADVSAIFTSLGADANRKKIAIKTPSEAECYVEIEKWDTAAKQAWLWVKVPSVSSSADTLLSLDYDKSRSDNASYVGDTGSAPAQQVWDAGFKLVYHLADSGTTVLDSTAHAHHGAKLGGVSTVAGLVGPSAQFDGSSGYITVADHDDFSLTTTGHLLISTWFSPTVLVMDPGERTADGQNRFFSKSASDNHEWVLNYYNKGSARDMGISFYLFNLPGSYGCGHYPEVYGTPANYLNPGEWEHLSGRGDVASAVINGATRSHWVSVYKNGVFKNGQSYDGTTGSGCDASSGMQVTPANGTAPVTLGHSPFTGSWLNARLDEVRIEGAARSDAWIKADYESQHDSLVSF